ncbi:RNB domain-containing ribonuclease [Janibacter indicus]|uniref:RNB domain-containing ribonuclease n=1 Tax=Janibacter indicus TaxID=857417 RepID=A0A7L9IXU7_9MICO|nr:RNB domain-containing ribonuclease [Janibacter indicus]QOK21603.1 RNB domain-containing ribonuclease [Janibacter indicus]
MAAAQRTVTLRPSDPQSGEVVAAAGLTERFDAIRAEQEVPDEFPADVLAEAERVAAQPLSQPERDESDLPFVTIDPPGSMDLDQAMHLSREGDGYRVRYAIAHLESFVEPGGAIDAEARRRGQTIYAPDERTPLHPPVLSEGAASLLPEEVRPAYVWDMRLDATGAHTSAELYPALVRSAERLEYTAVQAAVDAGTDDERLVLLKEIGELRIALEQERGGASLPMPDQQVEEVDGGFRLHLRPLVPAEDWNAQISLLTGIVAAEMMLEAGVGILRTMPEPEERDVQQLRRIARALGVEWAEGTDHGTFLRSLDGTDPKHLALIHESTVLFRGAGYTAFDGEPPEVVEQAAIAAPYAHVTAPLRRLVDRFGLALCAAVSAGAEVPGWVREALPLLPELMEASDRRAGAVERATTDAVEAATLADRVGQSFDAVVVDVPEGDDGKGRVQIQLVDPPVMAKASGAAELGAEVTVRLESVDLAKGRVELTVV